MTTQEDGDNDNDKVWTDNECSEREEIEDEWENYGEETMRNLGGKAEDEKK